MESVLKHIRSWRELLKLDANDLLRVATYRRLWLSILVSSLGGQVTMLALPLTAVLLLHASPTQMGLLTAMELLPFVLLSLPVGVWLDRVSRPICVGLACSSSTAVSGSASIVTCPPNELIRIDVHRRR